MSDISLKIDVNRADAITSLSEIRAALDSVADAANRAADALARLRPGETVTIQRIGDVEFIEAAVKKSLEAVKDAANRGGSFARSMNR